MNKLTIALAGNPNSGKTTLFNALTGSNQYVGNWPGVTVEKKEGKYKGDKNVKITDLPGIYSLSPYTLEEVVARNYLLNDKPDAILNIIDGTNLERNLYLTTQLLELGIPMVIAVNMMDVVNKRGDKIDIKALEGKLGCPVVTISAIKNEGIKEAAAKAIEVASTGDKRVPNHIFSGSVEHALAHIEEAVVHNMPAHEQRWYAVKLFERDDKIHEALNLPKEAIEHLENDITACEKEMDDDAESIITNERYVYISSIIGDCYTKKHNNVLSASDKIDRIVTNRFLALPIFALIMYLVYYISITTVGGMATDFVNDSIFGESWSLFGKEIPSIPTVFSSILESVGAAEWLHNLVVDGIVAGVGAVLGFVPQMLVLYLCLSILEGCGYMARVAFIMDRIFRKFGLSGKSFIPMLIGTGCSVPAIMATRTIENERDRRMTIMTTAFIPCGAKLPVIALFAGAIFNGASWVAWSAYFVGVAAIIISGIMLKKTSMFAGDPAPFVLELPDYHIPTVGSVLRATWERGWSFIKKAGTIILLAQILIWFTSGYGWAGGSFGAVDMEESILAKVGSIVAPIFAPLGFGSWKPTVGAVTGLIAKENVVGTFGVLYGHMDEVAEDGAEIWKLVAASFTTLSAYSYLVFNLLCAPCFAAIGAIRREMNNWKWTVFAVAYMCIFAYAISLMIYQFGMAIKGEIGVGTLVAAIVLIGMLYMLFKPYKESTKLSGHNLTAVEAAK